MRVRIVVLAAFILLPHWLGARMPGTAAVARVDSLLIAGLSKGYYPGVSLAVGNRSGLLFERYYGFTDQEEAKPVEADDVYDIASLTKVVATTFAVMRLYDNDLISLDRTVGDYLDTFGNSPVSGVTVRELLTHTTGLPYFPAYSLFFRNSEGGTLTKTRRDAEKYPLAVDKDCYLCASPEPDPRFISYEPREGYRRAGASVWVDPAADTLIVSRIVASYNENLRGRYRYSDTNFYILRLIIEDITGETLDNFTARLFRELDMVDTGYRPLEWKAAAKIIPTEYDHLFQRGMLRGYVHDDLAAANGGVEGNAGLYSNVRDLSRYCQMLINGGVYRGKTVVSHNTVAVFTASPMRARGIYRGLGFDKRGRDSALYDGFGHTGYTGTMLWIDPSRDIFMVFLSNRVHPSRLNTGLISSSLRVNIWQAISR